MNISFFYLLLCRFFLENVYLLFIQVFKVSEYKVFCHLKVCRSSCIVMLLYYDGLKMTIILFIAIIAGTIYCTTKSCYRDRPTTDLIYLSAP